MPIKTLIVRSSDPAIVGRALPWPVLEAGNESFPNGIYTISCEDKDLGKSFSLWHEVQGAPLIERWIRESKLLFICSVAAPASMYRAIHKSDEPEHLIEWQREDLGEYPMFTPMIVAREPMQHTANAAQDGLNKIWDGKPLSIGKGARVAIGNVFKFKTGINGILDFIPDDNLPEGAFYVEESTQDGFKFKVHLAKDLFDHLKYSPRDITSENIMPHIVSSALSILQKDYNEDGEGGWSSYPNLESLAHWLEEQNIKHWADDSFRPDKATTKIYPHKIQKERMNSSDD